MRKHLNFIPVNIEQLQAETAAYYVFLCVITSLKLDKLTEETLGSLTLS